ncbi:hypothetical protein FB451DRAFT_134694 [Mycena latifolia]|nr:hypothetical protein FB451DRAFT_134694 [Mycena latifolia]
MRIASVYANGPGNYFASGKQTFQLSAPASLNFGKKSLASAPERGFSPRSSATLSAPSSCMDIRGLPGALAQMDQYRQVRAIASAPTRRQQACELERTNSSHWQSKLLMQTHHQPTITFYSLNGLIALHTEWSYSRTRIQNADSKIGAPERIFLRVHDLWAFWAVGLQVWIHNPPSSDEKSTISGHKCSDGLSIVLAPAFLNGTAPEYAYRRLSLARPLELRLELIASSARLYGASEIFIEIQTVTVLSCPRSRLGTPAHESTRNPETEVLDDQDPFLFSTPRAYNFILAPNSAPTASNLLHKCRLMPPDGAARYP